MSEPAPPGSSPDPSRDLPHRRSFLSRASSLAMFGGLAASYGTLAAMAGRFMVPRKGRRTAWVFVTELARMRSGDSLAFRAPSGERIAIARQGSTGTLGDFIALSSTCPHLGCQVHWEGQNQRFFCPCHNGVFDPEGRGTGGPPGDAGQSLPRYPLRIQDGLLFIEVPDEPARTAAVGPRGAGHDECLQPRPEAGPGKTA